MTADRRNEVDLLAPWSAIDGLDEADEALLQDLLREEPELAHRIEAASDERDATVALNEALPSPSAKARDALFARIEQHEAAKSPLKSLGLGRWFAEKFLMSTGQLAFGAAAMLVIAVQGGFLAKAYLGGTGGSTYETASADKEVAVPGQTALVAFQPAATAADIAALLKDAKAEIIGGPKPGGVFLVRLSDKPMEKAALDEALGKLKAKSAVVKFAAPSAGAPAE